MLSKNNFFLVGIKGVGMTALASCLLDAGKNVSGSDVSESFPTSDNLQRLGVQIIGLDEPLPETAEVVIYTGSHGGRNQQQVVTARERGLITVTHMEAVAAFFNQKLGVAVCGVGGKSSISAILAFVGQKLQPQSYAVGVGEILGLEKTGQYLPESKYFIVEADEYIADPTVLGTPEAHIRFLYLQPQIIICPNLRFDHPDVYRDFEQTKQVFLQFFTQLKANGILIYNGDDENLRYLAAQLQAKRSDVKLFSYGLSESNDYCLANYPIQLSLPGEFNRLNALAALVAAKQMGWQEQQVLAALAQYRSVRRRMERLKSDNGVEIWDDYAHHPSEVQASIKALQAYRPGKRLVVAFQPHTYSRTKQLLVDFAQALATNDEVVLLDIFASAREQFDPTISSQMLAGEIVKINPQVRVTNLTNPESLKKYYHEQMSAGEILLTLGAGDIYHAVRSD
ncbi:hypothetical protein IJJ27_00800 [bacterium]|nr:hypothetical protein [bacterium]